MTFRADSQAGKVLWEIRGKYQQTDCRDKAGDSSEPGGILPARKPVDKHPQTQIQRHSRGIKKEINTDQQAELGLIRAL